MKDKINREILIIEGEPELGRLLGDMIFPSNQYKVTVENFDNAQKLLNLIRSDRTNFDLIILSSGIVKGFVPVDYSPFLGVELGKALTRTGVKVPLVFWTNLEVSKLLKELKKAEVSFAKCIKKPYIIPDKDYEDIASELREIANCI